MKKTKLWLLIAAAMILLGGILFTAVMCLLDWDFTRLSTFSYETREYTLTETYTDIFVDTNTADVTLLPASDGMTRVVCYEQENLLHSVSVQENTLTVQLHDSRKWYQHMGVNFATPKITVYLPTDTLETICVKVSTGKLELADITCKNFTTTGSTGKVSLKNLIATEKMELRRSTGDVALDGCDGAEIIVKTGTGDITGTLLSQKTFTAQTDTGRISVPQSTTGGPCTLTTSTGNIEIECKMQNA